MTEGTRKKSGNNKKNTTGRKEVKNMIQIKERPEEKIETKELKKIAAIYKEMNPTNRYLIMSASGMLLASQKAAEEGGDTDELSKKNNE